MISSEKTEDSKTTRFRITSAQDTVKSLKHMVEDMTWILHIMLAITRIASQKR